MIPLRDDTPSRSVPVITYGLIALNVLVFLYQLALGPGLNEFLLAWGVVPARVLMFFQGGDVPAGSVVWPIAGSMFLHGGWMHLIGNMWFLYIFGDNVEDRLGHLPYLLFYLGSGVAGSLVHIAFNLDSTVPSIGASGAISGVLAAYALFYPRARILTLIPLLLFFPLVEIPALFWIGFWFILQLVSGLGSLADAGSSAGGVGWWAHIGGFVFGLLVLFRSRSGTRDRVHSQGYY